MSTSRFSAAAARDARDSSGATVPFSLLEPCFLWPLRPPVKDVLLFGGIFLGAGRISSFELRTPAFLFGLDLPTAVRRRRRRSRPSRLAGA
eukprot:COSAG01_NODE_24279_length_784_cov_1.367883_2_plen_90_part_01